MTDRLTETAEKLRATLARLSATLARLSVKREEVNAARVVWERLDHEEQQLRGEVASLREEVLGLACDPEYQPNTANPALTAARMAGRVSQ